MAVFSVEQFLRCIEKQTSGDAYKNRFCEIFSSRLNILLIGWIHWKSWILTCCFKTCLQVIVIIFAVTVTITSENQDEVHHKFWWRGRRRCPRSWPQSPASIPRLAVGVPFLLHSRCSLLPLVLRHRTARQIRCSPSAGGGYISCAVEVVCWFTACKRQNKLCPLGCCVMNVGRTSLTQTHHTGTARNCLNCCDCSFWTDLNFWTVFLTAICSLQCFTRVSKLWLVDQCHLVHTVASWSEYICCESNEYDHMLLHNCDIHAKPVLSKLNCANFPENYHCSQWSVK